MLLIIRPEGNVDYKYISPIFLFDFFPMSFFCVCPGSPWGGCKNPDSVFLVTSLILELSNRVALAAVSFINCW